MLDPVNAALFKMNKYFLVLEIFAEKLEHGNSIWGIGFAHTKKKKVQCSSVLNCKSDTNGFPLVF